MNRLEDLFEDPPEPEQHGDFFQIETRFDSFAVSREVAVDVGRRLDQLPPPRWVSFRDLSGAWHRIVAESVYRISESTAAQRAANREFYRARRLEEKADRRPWEED
jgi:hypothetical protein